MTAAQFQSLAEALGRRPNVPGFRWLLAIEIQTTGKDQNKMERSLQRPFGHPHNLTQAIALGGGPGCHVGFNHFFRIDNANRFGLGHRSRASAAAAQAEIVFCPLLDAQILFELCP